MGRKHKHKHKERKYHRNLCGSSSSTVLCNKSVNCGGTIAPRFQVLSPTAPVIETIPTTCHCCNPPPGYLYLPDPRSNHNQYVRMIEQLKQIGAIKEIK